MLRFGVAVLLLSIGLTPARAGIDLSPVVEEYRHAGFQYRKATLKEDNGTVTFIPPQGWALRGGKDRLQLTPPDKKFVEATVTAEPLPAPPALGEGTVRVLEQEVLASAPSQSQSIQLLDKQENPVAVGSYPTYQAGISYVQLGETFQRSVIFVYTPDTRLVFRFSAPKADFDVLYQAFRRSIDSWEWIPAKPPAGSVTASPR